jgi:hypothetical protein
VARPVTRGGRSSTPSTSTTASVSTPSETKTRGSVVATPRGPRGGGPTPVSRGRGGAGGGRGAAMGTTPRGGMVPATRGRGVSTPRAPRGGVTSVGRGAGRGRKRKQESDDDDIVITEGMVLLGALSMDMKM